MKEVFHMDYGIISLLPAVIAIGLAIGTRQVVISLLTGVFVGAAIILLIVRFVGKSTDPKVLSSQAKES